MLAKTLIIVIAINLSPLTALADTDIYAKEGHRCSNLPVSLIKSVIKTESGGNPYAININGTGGFQPKTYNAAIGVLKKYGTAKADIGIMQINYAAWGAYIGISPEKLLDPMANACLGSLILKKYVETHGGFEGVGRYNAVSKNKQFVYVNKVLAAYQKSRN